MRDYRQIQVWQRSHQMTLSLYRATKAFPAEELYGLTSQVRRAGYSIPMNIAEGCGRSTDADFARFLDVAGGSASELDYQLLLSRDLGFLNDDVYTSLASELTEIRRMLTRLIQSVRKSKSKPTRRRPKTRS
jgi:four helix bundle protein